MFGDRCQAQWALGSGGEAVVVASGSFMGDGVAGEVGGVKGKPASEAGRSGRCHVIAAADICRCH